MQGSVRKRGSMWSYSFDMGTVGGKRQRKEKGRFRTKRKRKQHLQKRSANITTLVLSLNHPAAPFLIIWICGLKTM